MSLSKRQLEKIGTAFIAEQCYREGLRIAYPDIDDGVDLIIFRISEQGNFDAVPIQIKAFSTESFYTDKKYLEIPKLFIIYLWYVGSGKQIRSFGMLYEEAEKIVDKNHWSRKDGKYAYTRGSETLRNALVPFEIKSWKMLLFGN